MLIDKSVEVNSLHIEREVKILTFDFDMRAFIFRSGAGHYHLIFYFPSHVGQPRPHPEIKFLLQKHRFQKIKSERPVVPSQLLRKD
jgi:hypothetical protein